MNHMHNNYGKIYGTAENKQPPKLTNRLAEDYISYSLGVDKARLKLVKLPEQPTHWRHSCVRTGVVKFPLVDIFYYNTKIVYSVCPACGKVAYYYEKE